MQLVCNFCKCAYSSNDKKRKFCSKKCYFSTKNGKNNYFYNYKPSEEEKQRKSQICSELFKGEQNPFYGKQHTDEAKNKIKTKNEQFRENNKDLVERRLLDRLNLNQDKIKQIFDEYKNTHHTLITLQQKYDVDKRVLKKYMLKYSCTKEELDEISFNKKYKNATSVGEETLYLLLCNTFGEHNIKRQAKLSFYYYDFLIKDKMLVEYDGYYWHELSENNDSIKNDLAKKHKLFLYRVKEDEKRKVNFLNEIKTIKEVLDEIENEAN